MPVGHSTQENITELETLAVVWAISHFGAYLYGSKVTVYTDHSAVHTVLQDPHATGKHAKVYDSGLNEVGIIYQPGREWLCRCSITLPTGSHSQGRDSGIGSPGSSM